MSSSGGDLPRTRKSKTPAKTVRASAKSKSKTSKIRSASPSPNPSKKKSTSPSPPNPRGTKKSTSPKPSNRKKSTSPKPPDRKKSTSPRPTSRTTVKSHLSGKVFHPDYTVGHHSALPAKAVLQGGLPPPPVFYTTPPGYVPGPIRPAQVSQPIVATPVTTVSYHRSTHTDGLSGSIHRHRAHHPEHWTDSKDQESDGPDCDVCAMLEKQKEEDRRVGGPAPALSGELIWDKINKIADRIVEEKTQGLVHQVEEANDKIRQLMEYIKKMKEDMDRLKLKHNQTTESNEDIWKALELLDQRKLPKADMPDMDNYYTKDEIDDMMDDLEKKSRAKHTEEEMSRQMEDLKTRIRQFEHIREEMRSKAEIEDLRGIKKAFQDLSEDIKDMKDDIDNEMKDYLQRLQKLMIQALEQKVGKEELVNVIDRKINSAANVDLGKNEYDVGFFPEDAYSVDMLPERLVAIPVPDTVPVKATHLQVSIQLHLMDVISGCRLTMSTHKDMSSSIPPLKGKCDHLNTQTMKVSWLTDTSSERLWTFAINGQYGRTIYAKWTDEKPHYRMMREWVHHWQCRAIVKVVGFENVTEGVRVSIAGITRKKLPEQEAFKNIVNGPLDRKEGMERLLALTGPVSREKENEYNEKQQFRDMFAKKRHSDFPGDASTRASLRSDQSLPSPEPIQGFMNKGRVGERNGVTDSSDYYKYSSYTTDSTNQQVDLSSHHTSSDSPFGWAKKDKKKDDKKRGKGRRGDVLHDTFDSFQFDEDTKRKKEDVFAVGNLGRDFTFMDPQLQDLEEKQKSREHSTSSEVDGSDTSDSSPRKGETTDSYYYTTEGTSYYDSYYDTADGGKEKGQKDKKKESDVGKKDKKKESDVGNSKKDKKKDDSSYYYSTTQTATDSYYDDDADDKKEDKRGGKDVGNSKKDKKKDDSSYYYSTTQTATDSYYDDDDADDKKEGKRGGKDDGKRKDESTEGTTEDYSYYDTEDTKKDDKKKGGKEDGKRKEESSYYYSTDKTTDSYYDD